MAHAGEMNLRSSKALIATLVIVGTLFAPALPFVASATPTPERLARAAEAETLSGWVWPVASFRVSNPFIAPPGPYAAGHRGVDLEAVDGASIGATSVLSPATGIVAFSGQVAGRGVITIDHGGGLVTTLEPVQSDLRAGESVARGEVVATLSLGGHTAPGAMHFGVRRNGEYINPLLLYDGVPRAVLLPCCEPL